MGMRSCSRRLALPRLSQKLPQPVLLFVQKAAVRQGLTEGLSGIHGKLFKFEKIIQTHGQGFHMGETAPEAGEDGQPVQVHIAPVIKGQICQPVHALEGLNGISFSPEGQGSGDFREGIKGGPVLHDQQLFNRMRRACRGG